MTTFFRRPFLFNKMCLWLDSSPELDGPSTVQSSNDPCDGSSDRDPGVSDSVAGDWRDPGVSESVAGDWQG